MPLAARIPSEQALISFANGREEIITTVQLQSDKPGAAVIFPVPSVPQVSTLTSNQLFSYLEEITRPEVRTVEQAAPDGNRGAPAGGAAPAVNVLSRELIGGYDVAALDANNDSALEQWLTQNGYSAPPNAQPILNAYIGEGWKFVAVKLAADRAADGALSPLRLAFDSRTIVYPMRLGALADRPLDVLLYVLAEHRVDIPSMTTQYAGAVASLERPPPAELAALFRAPFLTKLRNAELAPASLTQDFEARAAASDKPYRMVETRTVYVSGGASSGAPLSPGPVIGLICVIVASSVALGVAFGIRRRIDRIAGPDPDKQDD
jgi:hypothetical protein